MSVHMNALDTAIDERDQLMRNYKRAKRAKLEKMFTNHIHGEQLRKFCATLNHFNRPEHAERLIEYVQRECASWLASASKDIRYEVLTVIDDRCVAIRLRAGMSPYHDSMPWEEPNVFFVCKGVLRL